MRSNFDQSAIDARKLSEVLGLLAQDLEEIGLNLQQPLNALLKH
jgi:hypothetical protein